VTAFRAHVLLCSSYPTPPPLFAQGCSAAGPPSSCLETGPLADLFLKSTLIAPRRMDSTRQIGNTWRSWLLCWVGRVTGEYSRPATDVLVRSVPQQSLRTIRNITIPSSLLRLSHGHWLLNGHCHKYFTTYDSAALDSPRACNGPRSGPRSGSRSNPCR
jgi:hypothetical protein